jgi:hypothetical protein
VHQRVRNVEVAQPPRMADFAAVLACVDEELGTTGLSRYREQARRIAADTLDHPFIAKLVEAMQSFEARTSAEILTALTPADKSWHAPRGWPVSAQAVTGQLTRHAPALRAQGWEVSDDGGHNHRNVLRWTIRPPENPGTKASRPSQAGPNGHHHTTPDTPRREGICEDGPRCTLKSARRCERGERRPDPVLAAPAALASRYAPEQGRRGREPCEGRMRVFSYPGARAVRTKAGIRQFFLRRNRRSALPRHRGQAPSKPLRRHPPRHPGGLRAREPEPSG